MFDWPSFNSRANDWTDMYLNLARGPGITSNACFDEKSPINFEFYQFASLQITPLLTKIPKTKGGL